jgi:hypothetical protein
MPVPAGTHGSPAGDGIGAPRRGRAQGRGAAAHPEHETGLGGGGKSRRTVNRRRRAPDTCGGNGDGQRGFRPSRGRKRAARQSSRAGRRSLGRHGTVRAGGGHGGHARVCVGERSRDGERASAREGEKVSERERGGRRGLIL